MELLETKHCNYESKRVKFVVASFEVPSKEERFHPEKKVASKKKVAPKKIPENPSLPTNF